MHVGVYFPCKKFTAADTFFKPLESYAIQEPTLTLDWGSSCLSCGMLKKRMTGKAAFLIFSAAFMDRRTFHSTFTRPDASHTSPGRVPGETW
jgi:hypothetical protein